MTSLVHKHADIAIYTLRCKVTKENDFSKYVKPKTAIRELSSNVKCGSFAKKPDNRLGLKKIRFLAGKYSFMQKTV